MTGNQILSQPCDRSLQNIIIEKHVAHPKIKYILQK